MFLCERYAEIKNTWNNDRLFVLEYSVIGDRSYFTMIKKLFCHFFMYLRNQFKKGLLILIFREKLT